jgi:hypothetical protein
VYQGVLPDDSLPRDAGSANPWFNRISSTSDAMIYRVRQVPRPAAVATIAEGSGAIEPDGNGAARWLEAPAGKIVIDVTGAPRRVTISLVLSSFRRSRSVVLRLDGRVVGRARVDGRYGVVCAGLGMLPPGPHRLELEPSPGAEGIGGADPRSVSLRLREIRVMDEAR